ncbi:MAG: hypothetical protein GX623_06155 [Clostridiales bacterium]|nr:hypothetical protein [Clostridiales bacterium]
MTVKKKAIKALLILFAVLLVSLFFARTVQTITTAKVRKVTATRGRLEEKIQAEGALHFSQGEPFTIEEARKIGVSIDKVLVKEGYFVRQGDPLFNLSIPTYQTEMKQREEAYMAAVRELSVEVTGHLRLQQSSPHNELYNQTLKSTDTYYKKRYAAMARAQAAGYTLPEDITAWGVPAGELPGATPTPRPPRGATPTPDPEPTPLPGHDAPEDVRLAMQEAFDAWRQMDLDLFRLRRVYVGGGDVSRTGDGTFEYIKKVDGIRERIDTARQSMLELDKLRDTLTTALAPRDGYVSQLDVKAGDSYDGSRPAYSLSPQNELPVIRVNVTDTEKKLTAGTRAEVEGLRNELAIRDIQTDTDGKEYAVIPLDEEALGELGGLSRLMDSKINVTFTYRAAQTTTLLPASALRVDSDGSRFVFVIRRDFGGMLGNQVQKLEKRTVKVIETGAQLVSVSDDLSYVEIADQEDRVIEDGQAVMDYVN